MRRTNKREIDLNQPSYNLNKSPVGCAPCPEKTLKIQRQTQERSLNEVKIKKIKEIVNSLFENKQS